MMMMMMTTSRNFLILNLYCFADSAALSFAPSKELFTCALQNTV